MGGDMNHMSAANAAPRCTARSKRTGLSCQAAAVKGWCVCRHHGAGGGHPEGPSHPSWRHGLRSRAAVEMRRLVNRLARETREAEALIGDGK
jgi:hypothetical protein